MKGSWTVDPRTWSITTIPETVQANHKLYTRLHRILKRTRETQDLPVIRIVLGSSLFLGQGLAAFWSPYAVLLMGMCFGFMHFSIPHMIQMFTRLEGTWTLNPKTWHLETIADTVTTNFNLWEKLLLAEKRRIQKLK